MALRFLWPAKELAAMPIYAKIRPKAILLVNNLAIYVNLVLKSQCKRRQLTAGSPVSELATSLLRRWLYYSPITSQRLVCPCPRSQNYVHFHTYAQVHIHVVKVTWHEPVKSRSLSAWQITAQMREILYRVVLMDSLTHSCSFTYIHTDCANSDRVFIWVNTVRGY